MAISAGYEHTCVLLSGGVVKCWGKNDVGQLGLGDKDYRGDQPGEMGQALPTVDLGSDRKASSITSGRKHTCTLLDDGSVKCWGQNSCGQLGLGDTSYRGDGPNEMGTKLPFVDLGSDQTVLSIVAGSGYTCAMLTGGTVKCWGYNDAGRLGLGDMQYRGDNAGKWAMHCHLFRWERIKGPQRFQLPIATRVFV